MSINNVKDSRTDLNVNSNINKQKYYLFKDCFY